MSSDAKLSEADLAAVERSVETFRRERRSYERLAKFVMDMIEYNCEQELIHATTFRAKEIDSFRGKCMKMLDDGTLKYSDPMSQITDLAGVRVIVFTRDAVDAIGERIRALFDVHEFQDVGERVFKAGKLGYQSKHFVVQLKSGGAAPAGDVGNAKCEIQVRTILQHAWAEMEHDIQYKTLSDVPEDLNKRFSALAGLLDIADREFAAIQKDSTARKSVVKEDFVSDLTAQSIGPDQKDPAHVASQKELRSVRDYISEGRYPEAIEIYSRYLAEQPSAHTLYIGRAKAHFLSGNVQAALADLDESHRLNPASEEEKRLRSVILTGNAQLLQRPETRQGDEDGLAVAQGYLAEGKGTEAFHEYHKFETAGFSRAKANLGKAMSCVLENDCDGADWFIGQLEVRAGAMGVTIRAVQGVIALLRGRDPDLELLDQALKASPSFVFSASPLASLRKGVAKRLGARHKAITFLDTIAQRNKEDRAEAAGGQPMA